MTERLGELSRRIHSGTLSKQPINPIAAVSTPNPFRQHTCARRSISQSRIGVTYLVFGPDRSSAKEDVPKHLQTLIKKLDQHAQSVEENQDDPCYEYNALHIAAWAHAEFIKIHPFEDGNGRVGRLLLNTLLVRFGLRPIPIQIPRHAYYEAMNIYQAEGDMNGLLAFFLGLMEEELDRKSEP